MMFTIINHGFRRAIPTSKGEVSLPTLVPIQIESKEVMRDLAKYPYIEVIGKTVDYASKKIWELRKLASKTGIKNTFSMKKSELVKKLEEKNELSKSIRQ